MERNKDIMDIDDVYKPEIEEFHIGFEYLFLKPNYEIINCKVGEVDDWDLMSINDDLNDNKIRVKYLDKEDIESLGGIFSDKGILINEKYDLWLMLITQDKSYNGFPGVGIFNRSLSQCVFSGTIKNKSELSKLMQQLGI